MLETTKTIEPSWHAVETLDQDSHTKISGGGGGGGGEGEGVREGELVGRE